MRRHRVYCPAVGWQFPIAIPIAIIMPMKTVQMTLDESLVLEVDRAAARRGTTRSAFTREALRHALRGTRRNVWRKSTAADTLGSPSPTMNLATGNPCKPGVNRETRGSALVPIPPSGQKTPGRHSHPRLRPAISPRSHRRADLLHHPRHPLGNPPLARRRHAPPLRHQL